MRIEPEKVFQQALESRSLRYTKQREEILHYLLKSKKHVTPEEMFRDLSQVDPSLGRATVFRTLNLLQEAGLTEKIQFADGKSAYEHKFSRPHHDHLICVECREVIEFSNPTIEKIQNKITLQYHFSPLWHRHEIFGRCKKCQKHLNGKQTQ